MTDPTNAPVSAEDFKVSGPGFRFDIEREGSVVTATLGSGHEVVLSGSEDIVSVTEVPGNDGLLEVTFLATNVHVGPPGSAANG